VGVGTRFSGTRWDWIVNGVQRVATAGNSKPRGIYYLVRVGATNKGAEGAQVTPNDFVLVDPNGIEHTALGLGSGVYQGPTNGGSSNIWPREFPVGKTVNFNVLFDVEPSLGRGMVFGTSEVPSPDGGEGEDGVAAGVVPVGEGACRRVSPRTPGSGRVGYCWSAWTSASHACMSRARSTVTFP